MCFGCGDTINEALKSTLTYFISMIKLKEYLNDADFEYAYYNEF